MLGKYPQVNIDEIFFKEDDCSLKEIDAILSATPFDLALATKRRKNLQNQLDFVTRKASQIILDRQQSYQVELSRVLELEAALRQANLECQNARSHIGTAKSVFTDRGLYLLGNCRHRRQLLYLLNNLRQIRAIRGTSARLTSHLSENDYSSAIELGITCQKEATSLSKFSCLKETSLKLLDALQSVEETMDSALSKHCVNFDPVSYAKLHAGYCLLGPGKLQVAADQLIMHAVNTLQDRCYSVLAGYAALTQMDGDGEREALGTFSAGRPFADVCKAFAHNADPTIVIAGVRDCAEAGWQVLSNFRRVKHWYSGVSVGNANGNNESSTTTDSYNLMAAAGDYVKMKLDLGRARIWQEVDGRMRVLLNYLCLDQFGSENFLHLLEILGVLLRCGNWFAEVDSPGINESINILAGRFFRSFHLRSLEEARLFFENEIWALCPLPRDFSIWSLPELKSLSKQAHIDKSALQINFEKHFEDDSSPYNALLSSKPRSPTTRERGMSMAAFDDMGSGGNGSDDPNQFAPVTNSTVSVIRIMAQYVCLLQPLSTIVMDIITGVADLYDRYLFFVFQTVRLPSSDHYLFPGNLLPQSQRLSGTIQRIQEQHNNNLALANALPTKLPECTHRILAAESVVFLGSQVEHLKITLEKHVPPQKAAFLVQFYSQSVKSAEDIRTLAYFPIGAFLVDSHVLIQRVSTVNFEPSDIQSQHSPYVDWIIQNILNGVDKLTVAVVQNGSPCPPTVRAVVVSAALRCATYYLLEGYSQVKKCKGEGRALMQLDVEQLSKAAERKLGVKPPLPGRESLDHFIRAFYLRDDNELETWMREHREFSSSQLQGLVNQLPWITARAKKRLTDLIISASQVSASPER